MDILIETSRLMMREFCLDDVDDVYEFSTHPEVVRYTGDAGVVKTREDARNLITDLWQVEYRKYGYARYALIHKADKKVIGFCGIKYEPELGEPDIGYRMLPEYWGKGLAMEAAKAILDYARSVLGLNKIIGEVAIGNIASSKILLNLGFKLVDTYKRDGFTLNRYEVHLSEDQEKAKSMFKSS